MSLRNNCKLVHFLLNKIICVSHVSEYGRIEVKLSLQKSVAYCEVVLEIRYPTRDLGHLQA